MSENQGEGIQRQYDLFLYVKEIWNDRIVLWKKIIRNEYTRSE